MTQRILIVEDERDIVAVVKGYLEQAGYQTLSAYDGKTGLFMARQEKPDLVVLDLMLPEMDGLDVCRAIRRDRDPIVADAPIIMLTARVEETDKLIGLELGADDYVTKPFSPRELVARVRTVLRRLERADRTSEERPLHAGDLTLDPTRREARLDDRLLDLTPTEFDLLHVLMANPGRPFSRLELLERLQGEAYAGYERTIDVHIKNLRKKLGEGGRTPRYIKTVLNVGYKFAASVTDE
jgi:two-component system alkaline phosphatase synthesis response regulator PhoP